MKLFNKEMMTTLLIMAVVMISNVSAQQKMDMEKQLSSKEQNIIAIAAVTAKGDLIKLKPVLNTALDAGLTVNEIKETIVHLYAYAGFPRSLRGLQTFMAVLDERKAKGIDDKIGLEASPIKDERSKYERGKAILEELTGVPETGPKRGYATFAPEI